MRLSVSSLVRKKSKKIIESGIIKSYVGTMSVTHAGSVNQGKSFVWDAKEFDKDGKLLTVAMGQIGRATTGLV